MPELNQVNQYQFVTLVNRTQEPAEFIFDGVRFTFKPGEAQTIPAWVAEWLYATDRCKIHTTEGDYTFRFGVKEFSEDLIGKLEDEAFDCTPIERKKDAVEGWDTRDVMRDPAHTKVIGVRPSRQDYINQGNVATVSMGAPAHVLKEG